MASTGQITRIGRPVPVTKHYPPRSGQFQQDAVSFPDGPEAPGVSQETVTGEGPPLPERFDHRSLGSIV